LISAQCLAPDATIKSEADQTNSGSAPAVSGPNACSTPGVGVAAVPASSHHVVSGLALAALVLAAAALVLFGGWLRYSPRRGREDGLALR
jgi:hypothetical protein